MIRNGLQAGIEGISIKKQGFIGKMKRKGECCIFHGETFLGYGMILFQPFISCERFFLFPFFRFYSRLCNSPGMNAKQTWGEDACYAWAQRRVWLEGCEI